MRWYAERPGRVARQVVADLCVIGWVVLCVKVAQLAHGVVLVLQDPGVGLTRAGNQMQVAFADAARTAGRVPLIGADLARALGAGVDAGVSLTTTGQQQAGAIQQMANGTAVSVVLVGAVPVVLVWLWLRLRYARAAGNAA